MHNLTKIKIFRSLLLITYPFAILFIYPFVALKKKKRSSLFFFFDRYSIGGAQHVYLQILESVEDQYRVIYFTRKSSNELKDRFYSLENTECHDVHTWCDNLFFRMFTVHYFAFYINRHKDGKVLGSNSTFFYDLLPFLKHRTKIELLHNFSYGKKGMEFFGLANYKHLDYRMVIDSFTQKNIAEQYSQYNIPKVYNERVKVAEYGITIPPLVEKILPPPLKVLYAGRGTKQKRVWLLNEIAEHFISNKSKIQFSFAGPLSNELSASVKKNFDVLGEIGDEHVMHELFAQHHVVILTSAFEGFPVVVKEGMAHGCIPLVTALPANKSHLQHMQNSLLIEGYDDEEQVVKNGIELLEHLIINPQEVGRMSANAYAYAQKKFGKQEFIATYRKLLS